MTTIAGLNHAFHDPAACLVVDGRLEVVIEQERLSTRRYAEGESPVIALLHALSHLGLSLRDVDIVALGSDHAALARSLDLDDAEAAIELPYDPTPRLRSSGLHPSADVVSIPHHVAHAHSTFWPSGFERAGVLVVDARGEAASASIGKASRLGGLHLEQRLSVDDSIGYFYEAACAYVGFGRHSSGKLMGLAAYGTPTGPVADVPAFDLMAELSPLHSTGQQRVAERRQQLLDLFARHYFPYEAGSSSEPLAYADFAASAQRCLEQAMVALAREAVQYAGSPDLVVAGGVGLNCSANGVIAELPEVRNLFVQPASVDSGTAIGAAFAVCDGEPKTAQQFDPYLGFEELDLDYAVAVRSVRGCRVVRLSESDLIHAVARHLASEKIVAWHQGRAEIGPRALGARSLLADPRSRRMTTVLNSVKERESWRPIAPSVIDSRFHDYFIGTPNSYMLVAAEVRPDRMEEIPAVVHVDRTARPQSVTAALSPRFYALLCRFEAETGCSMLANTSLNPRGRAPSSSVVGTIDFFQACPQIEVAAIGSYLIEKI